MNKSKVTQVLSEMKGLAEAGKGPEVEDIDRWIDLLEEASKE